MINLKISVILSFHLFFCLVVFASLVVSAHVTLSLAHMAVVAWNLLILIEIVVLLQVTFVVPKECSLDPLACRSLLVRSERLGKQAVALFQLCHILAVQVATERFYRLASFFHVQIEVLLACTLQSVMECVVQVFTFKFAPGQLEHVEELI